MSGGLIVNALSSADTIKKLKFMQVVMPHSLCGTRSSKSEFYLESSTSFDIGGDINN